VPGAILLPPAGSRPFPVALLAHPAASASGSALDAVAGPWVRRGAAVACVDLPLHGARASAKLGGLLRAGLEAGTGSSLAAGILREWSRQAVVDLRRCLDALARVGGLDAGRVAFAGIGLGARVGAALCALDPRPRAAALAFAGAGDGPPELDPARYVGRIAPRPVLFVSATGDAGGARAAEERLHAAAREPREVLWVEAPGELLPARAVEAIGLFLLRHLGAA
jgi:dienelactone hydrolase